MRRLILILGAAGSTLAITSAGAAGLGTLNGGSVLIATSGTTTVDSVRCTDPFNVTYTLDHDKQYVESVTVTDTLTTPGAGCGMGNSASILLADTPPSDDPEIPAPTPTYTVQSGLVALDAKGAATLHLTAPGYAAALHGIAGATVVIRPTSPI